MQVCRLILQWLAALLLQNSNSADAERWTVEGDAEDGKLTLLEGGLRFVVGMNRAGIS